MKKFILFTTAALLGSSLVFAGAKDGKKKKAAPQQTGAKAAAPQAAAARINDTEVHWMTLEQAEAAMKTKPKKLWIDVYTDWCGWCKVMDKKTYTNEYVAQYMNEHFYAVRLNAEQTDSITFQGKRWGLMPESKTNELAYQLLDKRLSYPTSVFIDETFTTKMPIPGYQDVAAMELILKYLAQGLYKTTPFDTYQRDFKASWQ